MPWSGWFPSTDFSDLPRVRIGLMVASAPKPLQRMATRDTRRRMCEHAQAHTDMSKQQTQPHMPNVRGNADSAFMETDTNVWYCAFAISVAVCSGLPPMQTNKSLSFSDFPFHAIAKTCAFSPRYSSYLSIDKPWTGVYPQLDLQPTLQLLTDPQHMPRISQSRQAQNPVEFRPTRALLPTRTQ